MGGAVLLITVLIQGKFFWNPPTWPLRDERDPRWAWIAPLVPQKETVYWVGLDNYAWAPWRYFDTGRMAVGMTEAELAARLADDTSPIRFLALPRESRLAARLSGGGWRLVGQEPETQSDAQMLWVREHP